jgi:HEAT repeat protein
MKPFAPFAAAILVSVCSLGTLVEAQVPARQAPPPTASDVRRALAEGRTADAARLADALVRSAPKSRDAAEIQIQIFVRLEDVPRALAGYDRYVAAVGRPDGALLGPIALQQLRITAANAVDDPRLAVEALERLARAGDPTGKARLQQMSIDEAGTTKGILADGALARLGDDSAAARLSALVSSESFRNKGALAEELARIGSKASVADLRALLQDSDPYTRITAMTALGNLGDKESIPVIRGMLSDDYPPVRSYAALTLKRLGDTEGNEAVARMMTSPAGDVRLEALAADRTLPGADRRTEVRALLADPSPLTQIKAAQAIAADDPETARSVLARVAGDPDVTTRRAAARALEALKPADLGLFRRLLADPSDWVRVYAAGGILAALRDR